VDLTKPIELRQAQGTGNVTVNEGRFSMTPYEGQVIEWMGDRLVVDIDSVKLRKDVVPAFVDHDPARMAGEIDNISVEGGKITLSGEFIDTPHAGEIQAKKKLEYESSMKFDPSVAMVKFYDYDETFEANGREYEGPAYFMKDVALIESSFTHYGAVNGASAEFSKESKEVSMSGQGKGGESPQKSAQDVLAQMVELSGDKSFATDCFLKGMDMDEFKSRHAVALSAKNQELETANAELATEIVELKKEIVELKKENDDNLNAGGDATPHAEKDFITLSKDYAKEHSVSISDAMAVISSEKPELYAKLHRRSN